MLEFPQCHLDDLSKLQMSIFATVWNLFLFSLNQMPLLTCPPADKLILQTNSSLESRHGCLFCWAIFGSPSELVSSLPSTCEATPQVHNCSLILSLVRVSSLFSVLDHEHLGWQSDLFVFVLLYPAGFPAPDSRCFNVCWLDHANKSSQAGDPGERWDMLSSHLSRHLVAPKQLVATTWLCSALSLCALDRAILLLLCSISFPSATLWIRKHIFPTLCMVQWKGHWIWIKQT